jgi:uncharacterized YigZ family protein
MSVFRSVSKNIENSIVVTKSKFISNIFYVENIQEADNFIKSIRKKYNDARHHCYAYIIQNGNDVYSKSSDDGEPSGTAGDPILQVLTKGGFSNTLIVVTRYFGGILLGTGGLVRAYTDAAKSSLVEDNIVTKAYGHLMEMVIPYDKLEEVKYKFSMNNIKISNIEYTENIKLTLEVLDDKLKYIEEEYPEIKMIKDCIIDA